MHIKIRKACQPRLPSKNVDINLRIQVVQRTGLRFGESAILPQHRGIALLRVDVAIRVHELTAFSKRANSLLVEGVALPGPVVFRHVVFLLKVGVAVGVGALGAPVARPFHLPIPTHLSLFLVRLRGRIVLGLSGRVTVKGSI